MHLRRPWSLLACPLLLLVSCCGPARVGYEGPMPSEAARESLAALWGKRLPAGSVAFCASELELRDFLVGPQGPLVIVDDVTVTAARPAGRYWVMVLTDGDIADLHRLATGATPPGLGGDLSEAYRRQVRG
jgi:hypothetical protein